MYEELFEAVGEAPGRGGAWEDQLPADERELLPAFQLWLVESDEPRKSKATATAYRGYVAQAMVRLRKGEPYKELSTDIRSAVNAFVRWATALKEFEAAADGQD